MQGPTRQARPPRRYRYGPVPGRTVRTRAPGLSFLSNGIDHTPWLLRGGIGYTHRTDNDTEVSLRHDVESRSDYLHQSASVRAKWAF